jgi:hypothetical protein
VETCNHVGGGADHMISAPQGNRPGCYGGHMTKDVSVAHEWCPSVQPGLGCGAGERVQLMMT